MGFYCSMPVVETTIYVTHLNEEVIELRETTD